MVEGARSVESTPFCKPKTSTNVPRDMQKKYTSVLNTIFFFLVPQTSRETSLFKFVMVWVWYRL